jgi:ubiquinone/menaquinone biosynthesis C-methylase UbiE
MARGNYGTELLAAAVNHLNVFGHLAAGPLGFEDLRDALGLAARPATVLVVALRAMGLLVADASGRLDLSPLARAYLVPGGDRYVGDYVGLIADTPGVKDMVRRLRTNRPGGATADDPGTAFIFKPGTESAMEHEASARRLTLALAGRAKIVAPVLAERVPLSSAKVLLDVGGGTGIYSLAFLRKNPGLRAIVWDRAEVLKVAREMADAAGLTERVELRPGDMFTDPVPAGCDVVLLSNILHDWDVPECQALLTRCAAALPPGGRLLIHDVFLHDTLDGPLPLALYSAALFSITEGRAYSAAEYRAMLAGTALVPGPVVPTLIHCGVLPAVKGVSPSPLPPPGA